MPDFLEEFASSIGNKKEALKEKIFAEATCSQLFRELAITQDGKRKI